MRSIVPPQVLAELIIDTLQEARDLTIKLEAKVLQYFVEMALLEAAEVERELLSKPRQEPSS